MMRLYLKECKKLFVKPITLVLFIITLGFGFATMGTNTNVQELSGLDEQGQMVEGKQAQTLLQSIQKEYTGEVNETWFAKIEKDYISAKTQDPLTAVDEERMIQAYGTTWKQAYLSNPDGYEYYTSTDIDQFKKEHPGEEFETTKPIFYLKTQTGFIRTMALQRMHNYGEQIIGKPWNHETTESMIDQFGERIEMSMQFARSLQPDEKAWMTQQLNEIPSFTYGSSEGWDSLLSGMASARFFLAIFILFTTSRLFNDDHSYGLYDLIKSTSYGKFKVVFAKLFALFSFCTLTIVAYTAVLTLSIYLTQGLGNWNVNLLAIRNVINLYTIKEAYLGGFLFLLAGSYFIGFLSASFSTIIKRNYLSFIVSVIALLAPMVLPTSLKLLFPIEYMDFTGTFFYNQTTSLFGTFQMTQPYVYGSAIVLIGCCSILMVVYYRSYHMTKS